MNNQVNADRLHIGFFGLRNAGKSSVVNAVTGQNLALVSDTKGTTTDPVKKAMELLPLGPVVIIDTPGIDDEGELGQMRVARAYDTLNTIDVAILVTQNTVLSKQETALLNKIEQKNIPHLVVHNKSDIISHTGFAVSAKTGDGIDKLKEQIAKIAKSEKSDKKIVGDLLCSGDVVVLVTPIDASAPKGRLILPQQQTIRDILDADCIAVVTKDTELEKTLERITPKMVITDSQAFGKVNKIVPDNIPLTSFSILFARYKGDLKTVVEGAVAIDNLKDGDTVLISEGCTHHRQCEDIGTVKMPRWIKEYTKKDINFEFTSGGEFPDDLSRFACVIHCGGCMLTPRQMKYRLGSANDKTVPITNYGIAIAHMNGILKRSVAPFSDIAKIFE